MFTVQTANTELLQMKKIKRTHILNEITQYALNDTPTAGFCYFRGRRRVGKSTCLELLTNNNKKNFFYFMGRPDERSHFALLRLIKSWEIFAGEEKLSRFKSSELSWDMFFDELNSYLGQQSEKLCLIFDEIQWIAKEKSGFLGALKQHWIQLERNSHLKILLCGSSNKFFYQMTGGEEKLIRGLKTRSDLWLHQLSLREVKKNYSPNFSIKELLLAYSFMGGIPYYWNQIDLDLNFIQSMNKSFFTPENIFLEEYLEMLNLEFQKNSIQNITLILKELNGSGKTSAAIAKDSRLSDSTVSDLLLKLENYRIIFSKQPLFAKTKIQRGSLYYIRDFYLNFYFKILINYKSKIQRNIRSELIFADLLNSSKYELFLNNYTGSAFELIIQNLLEMSSQRDENIFKKLQIKNCQFNIGFHWDQTVQFDLILHNTTDRVYRFIECKWTQDKKQITDAIENFSRKVEPLNVPYQLALCLNHKPNEKIIKLASDHKVTLIYPEDLL